MIERATGARPPWAVVIVSHNREDLIVETIASVQTQGAALDRADVFLADDGSSDATVRRALERWTSDRPLAILQPERNVGQWRNLNHALERLTPAYAWAVVLHDDDKVAPDWLERTFARLELAGPRTATVCSSWDTLEPDGTIVPGERSDRPVELIEGNEAAVQGTLLRGCWWHLSGAAIRLDSFLDVGRFNPEFPHSADLEWLVRSLDRGWHAEYIPRSLVIYRQHAASVSAGSFRTHQDIVEQVRLIERFGHTLKRGQAAALHARLLSHLGRRAARAFARRQGGAVGDAVRLAPRLAASGVRTVLS